MADYQYYDNQRVEGQLGMWGVQGFIFLEQWEHGGDYETFEVDEWGRRDNCRVRMARSRIKEYISATSFVNNDTRPMSSRSKGPGLPQSSRWDEFK